MAKSIIFSNNYESISLLDVSESIEFKNNFGSIQFSNSEESINFRNASKKLIFDIIVPSGSGAIPYIIPHLIP